MNLRHRWIRFLFSREVITYILVGVLTTLVNLAVFTLLSAVFGHDRWWLSNFPAITTAIVFAFFANRIIVFRSHGPIGQEMVKFFLSRIFVSLLFEYGAMFLLYNILKIKTVWHVFGWEIGVSKLLTQIFVMAGNYVISKWLVFNRMRNKDSVKHETNDI